MHIRAIISGALLAAALAAAIPACAGEGALIGTAFGAAAGGLFGSQFGHGASRVAATGAGIVGGALVGDGIGEMADAQSAQNYNAARPIDLYSDTPAISYTAAAPNYVAPPAQPPTYIDQDSQTYCRTYSQEVRLNGRMREAYGTACLQPDGTWRIMQ